MNQPRPRVSIGLPVYNGERFLSEAINSLLAQTFKNFEIIICDNASTDRSEEICQSFVRQDERIRYYRNPQNLGATANFNRTVELASGEYFKWAADDDICAPDLLQRCVEVLDKDSSVVLCQSEVTFIDENGKFIKNYDSKLYNFNSQEPHLRFADYIRKDHWCFDVFGLIRVDALKRTPLIASYAESDRNTLAVLSLLGRFHRIPERLFFSRDHSERSIRKHSKTSFRTEWFDPAKRGRVAFPHWRICLEYVRDVTRTKLPLKQRIACYVHILRWIRSNTRFLKRDVRVAVRHTIGSLLRHIRTANLVKS